MRVELPDKLAPVCLFRVAALRFLVVVVRPTRHVSPRSRACSSGTRLLQDARLGLVRRVHGGGFPFPGPGCGALDLVLLLWVVVRRRRRSIEGVHCVVRRVLLLVVVVRRRRRVVERMTGMQRGCVALIGVTVRVRVRRIALHGSLYLYLQSPARTKAIGTVERSCLRSISITSRCLRTTAAVVVARSTRSERALGSADE